MRTSTKNILILSLIMFFGSASVAVYITLKISDSALVLIKDSTEIKKRDQSLLAYDQLRSRLEVSREERQKLNDYVLSGQDDTVKFLSRVDELARNLNLGLSTQRLDEVVNKEGQFDNLMVDFSVTGSDRNVLRFVQALESLPLDSDLVGLSVQRRTVLETGSIESDAKVSLRISLKKE